MKGLAITILLAALELSAAMSSNTPLLADSPPNLPAMRREEAGIQSEVLVEAERPELFAAAPEARVEAI